MSDISRFQFKKCPLDVRRFMLGSVSLISIMIGAQNLAYAEDNPQQPATNPVMNSGAVGGSDPKDTKTSEIQQNTAHDLPAAPIATATSAPSTDAALPLPDQIKSLLADTDKTQLPRTGAFNRHIAEDIAAFYNQNNNQPLWIKDQHWTEAARSIRARLAQAEDDALDLKLTPLPDLDDDAHHLARAEIDLTRAVVNYARQANGARIDPRSIADTITEKPEIADVVTILSSLPSSSRAGDYLAAYNPPQAAYQSLRTKLADLRKSHPRETQHPLNLTGPVLRTGMSDDRVPLIRKRLGLNEDPATSSTQLLYDAKLASAVADFQRSAGLPATGTFTARTAHMLSNQQSEDLESEIIANMERWRWMPRNMGQNHIEVNIPDYSVRVIHGAQTILQERVVVGKPTTPTPIFSNVMQFLIINPYWNVPASIIKKEMLPKLAEDPNYLQKLGYEVIKTNNRLIVRQPPGERNALGRIKFMFPNDHAVYLHDTPQRNFFAAQERAFSHGCVRVDQPLRLAEVVLGPDQGWSEERVKKMIGGAEKTVHLPEPLPIHIGYFTAFFDESGQLQTRKDIYGYSQKVRTALGLNS